MEPQVYKFLNTHAHEISVWKILSIIIHALAHNIGGMNVDVQSDLSTPPFEKGEQLEYFIEELSDLINKLIYLWKLSLLQDFSFITQRNCQRNINSSHSLGQR